MYAEMLERVIQEKIREVTAAEGIERVEFMESKPDVHPWFTRLVQAPGRTSA